MSSNLAILLRSVWFEIYMADFNEFIIIEHHSSLIVVGENDHWLTIAQASSCASNYYWSVRLCVGGIIVKGFL